MSEAGIAALFDRAATSYDAERPKLVPCFDAFYAAALAPLGKLPRGARVLDLGAGTGLLSGMLAAGRPDLALVLVDIAPGMLEIARQRFAALGGQPPELVVADYAQGLPEGPFAAVISALSIHHLDDAGKARTLRTAFQALSADGIFVNAEQVAGATPAEDAALDRAWEASALAAGATPEMIARARERMAHDLCVTEADNLALLSAAGFRDPACTFREGRFAVFTAPAS